MKVLMINGSPHEHGCTYTALLEVAKSLNEQGIETEIYQLGKEPIAGCLGCGACAKLGKCVTDDKVSEFIEKAKTADGFIFGSPVYYASPAGSLICFMNRVFYSGGKYLAYKPASAVVSSRRAGSTTTFDALNKYFTINNMPIVPSNYSNEVHGANGKGDDVLRDEEGLQTMRLIGNNMAWLLQCLALGKEKGIAPKTELKIRTNFIQ